LFEIEIIDWFIAHYSFKAWDVQAGKGTFLSLQSTLDQWEHLLSSPGTFPAFKSNNWG
jgi:hypothetical protein